MDLIFLESKAISYPMARLKNIFPKSDWQKKGSTFFVSKTVGYKKRGSFHFPASHASEKYLSAISLVKITLCYQEKLASFLSVGFTWGHPWFLTNQRSDANPRPMGIVETSSTVRGGGFQYWAGHVCFALIMPAGWTKSYPVVRSRVASSRVEVA